MAFAVFKLTKTYGTSPGTSSDCSGKAFGFLSTDTNDAPSSANAVAVPLLVTDPANYSYESWLRLVLTSAPDNSVTSLKIWGPDSQPDGDTKITDYVGTTATYATPSASASSVATDRIVETFNVPVFEVITPAVETAVAMTKTGAVGVIGTRATIASGIYEKKIIDRRPDARVYSLACPLLVPLVEEGWMKKPETAMIVRKYLHPLKTKPIDALILGCTHYPILKKKFPPVSAQGAPFDSLKKKKPK